MKLLSYTVLHFHIKLSNVIAFSLQMDRTKCFIDLDGKHRAANVPVGVYDRYRFLGMMGPVRMSKSVTGSLSFGGKFFSAKTKGRTPEYDEDEFHSFAGGSSSEGHDHMWEVHIVCDGHGNHKRFSAVRNCEATGYFISRIEELLHERLVYYGIYGIRQFLEGAFNQIDEEINVGCIIGGCTVTMVILFQDNITGEADIVTAHCGDSKIVLIRNDDTFVDTEDHGIHNLEEVARVTAFDNISLEDPYVVAHSATGGATRLAMTRSMGDYNDGRGVKAYAPGAVIATPTVQSYNLNDIKTVLLFSDGLLERFNELTSKFAGIGISKEVVNAYKVLMEEGEENIAERLIGHFYDWFCLDNMSATVLHVGQQFLMTGGAATTGGAMTTGGAGAMDMGDD